MILDKAIAHEKELAKEIYIEAMLCHANPDDEKLDGCIERGKYHEQLAEWLEELKSSRQELNELRKYSYVQGLSDGYINAIDDFVANVKDALITDYSVFNTDDIRIFIDIIEEIAEQLKAGVTND